MEVDSVMRKFGFCGKWQVSIYLLIVIAVKFPAGWNLVSIVWIGYKPPHHCKIPDNSSVQEWIPSDESGKLSSCSMFVNSSNQTTACANGWQYNQRESGPTVVTKWDLVCDRTYLLQLSQMMLAVGLAIGSLIFTKLSDKFGRKWVLISTLIFTSLFGLLSVSVQRLEIFIAVRFFVGFFLGGSLVVQSVFVSEILHEKNREFYMIIGDALWAVGLSLLPLIAYVASNWIYMQMFISFYGLLFIPVLIWYLPETVYWLHANNRIEEAEKVLLRASRMNKVVLRKPILKLVEGLVNNVERDGLPQKSTTANLAGKSNGSGFIDMINRRFINNLKTKKIHLKTQYSITELVKNRYLRRHMLLAIIIFIDVVCYYGGTYMSASLSSNHFLSGFLSTIVEIPACIVMIICVNKFGRKRPIIVYHIGASICIFACIITVTLEEHNSDLSYATLTFNTVFKFFMSGAFSVIYFYAHELFPTNLRNQSHGICIAFGRLGTIIASYSSFIIALYPRILYAVFGILPLLGGLLVMVLPETSKRAFPETVEEIEAWYIGNDVEPGIEIDGDDNIDEIKHERLKFLK